MTRPRCNLGGTFLHPLHRIVFALLFLLFAAPPCAATDTSEANDLTTRLKLSPQLGEFLRNHPAATGTLAKVMAEDFASRKIRVDYFHSKDESQPDATHNYPDKTTVLITVTDDLKPVDEFICLTFEAVNSEGEDRFLEIEGKAQEGAISRTNFAREIVRQEFQAVKKMQRLLRGIDLSKKEIAESKYYPKFAGCPDDFEEFLVYIKKVSPKREVLKDYEKAYDTLNTKSTANPSPKKAQGANATR